MQTIASQGHSRIPIYSDDPANIIGLILVRNAAFPLIYFPTYNLSYLCYIATDFYSMQVKNLMFYHPENESPLKTLTIRRILRYHKQCCLKKQSVVVCYEVRIRSFKPWGTNVHVLVY